MQAVEVTRNDSPLQQHWWRFWFDDRNCVLWLDYYSLNERQSTRHKFKSVHYYTRTDRRSCNIALDDVPLPQDVQDEAKGSLIARITVQKWQKD
jgi:hypothetical protein